MAILKSHLHHPLNDCSSPRIHLLPDFSTSVYSVDGSAHQPPLSGFAHKPCERTIVLTSRTLLRLHQRVHVMHPQGTVNSTATRTQTGFTKVRHLERTMKPSKRKKRDCWHTERCRTIENDVQPYRLRITPSANVLRNSHCEAKHFESLCKMKKSRTRKHKATPTRTKTT